MRPVLWVLALLVMILASPVSGVLANDAALGRAGSNVMPVYDVPVRMVHERVDINLQTNSVDAIFTFQNLGPEATILMGFPMLKEQPDGADRGDDRQRPYFGYAGFKAYLVSDDGRQTELTTEEKDGLRPPSGEYFSKWVVFRVPFKQGETKTVRNVYKAEYAYVNSIGEAHLEYVLSTGATWQGPIGKSEVNVFYGDIAPHTLTLVRPFGYTIDAKERVIRWVFKDLKPTRDDNIQVTMRNSGWFNHVRSREGFREWYDNKGFDALIQAINDGDDSRVLREYEALLGLIPVPRSEMASDQVAYTQYNQRATILFNAARQHLSGGNYREAIRFARQYYKEASDWPGGRDDYAPALWVWIEAAVSGGFKADIEQAIRECSRYGVCFPVFREWAYSYASVPESSRRPPGPSGFRLFWEKVTDIFRGPRHDLVSKYSMDLAEAASLAVGEGDSRRHSLLQHNRGLIDLLYGLSQSRAAKPPAGNEAVFEVLLHGRFFSHGPIVIEVRANAIRVREAPGGTTRQQEAWYSPGPEFWDVIARMRSELRR